MKKCPICGHQTEIAGIKCPVCGNDYSKIIELIDNEEKNSFRGRFSRLFHADHVKRQHAFELNSMASGLNTAAKFTLFIVFVFIFALLVSI